MKASLLARLIVSGFIAIFVFAGAYLLLDAFGIWPRLPAGLSHGAGVLTGLILLQWAQRSVGETLTGPLWKRRPSGASATGRDSVFAVWHPVPGPVPGRQLISPLIGSRPAA